MKQKITFLKKSLIVAAIIIAGTNAYAQTLVAHYKFDGDITDETGNWDLVESTGFTATYDAGKAGDTNGAVSGFGAADFLETATNFSISGNASRTMAAWIKPTANVGSGHAMAGLGVNATGEKWSFLILGLKLRIEITGKGFNAPSPANDFDIVTPTWYHVAVVFDNSIGAASIKLYINGVQKASNNWQNDVDTAATPLRVGNDFNVNIPGAPARGFQGSMDDLRIYDGAADATFITNLFNASTLSTTSNKISNSFTSYPNPVKDRLYFSTNAITSVEIYNLLGSKIASQKVNDGVDMSSLSKGVYLVKGLNAEGVNIATIKAVKE